MAIRFRQIVKHQVEEKHDLIGAFEDLHRPPVSLKLSFMACRCEAISLCENVTQFMRNDRIDNCNPNLLQVRF